MYGGMYGVHMEIVIPDWDVLDKFPIFIWYISLEKEKEKEKKEKKRKEYIIFPFLPFFLSSVFIEIIPKTTKKTKLYPLS